MAFDPEEYFNNLGMFGVRLGLDATRELARRAGNPERKLKFIHLAGTNGKGSTGAMLECACRRAGLKTGFYTSPHLVYLRERFRINGKSIGEEDFSRAVCELKQISSGGSFSYFESATVLAMKLFADAGCDVVIWETGMGGRLDATNIVTPVASVITNIALDHMQSLGETLEAIAGEKAGIIKPGVPVFAGVMPQEALEVIKSRANELASPFFAVEERDEGDCSFAPGADGRLCQSFTYMGKEVKLPLLGQMQRRNYRLVHKVLTDISPVLGIDADAALDGIACTRWPGRFQMVNDKLLVDGAHNPDGISALLDALEELYPGQRFPLIYGAFKDKHVEECLPELAKKASSFYFTPLAAEGRESYSGAELCEMVKSWSDAPSHGCTDAKDALLKAGRDNPESVILSAGSLYLAGEILALSAAPTLILDIC